jgi:hypothetical protein
MNAELDTLIEHFRSAQDIGVTTLVDSMGLKIPSSGHDWVVYCCDNELAKESVINGVGIYTHGYGVELKIGNLTIDFDWGPNGERDVFDAWRLYNFTIDNVTGVDSSHFDVIDWIEAAHNAGELAKIEYNYFDPNRRWVANSHSDANDGG